MAIDIEEQYDKIYRYCYFKLHDRELAEDITQETFLRYLEHYHCAASTAALKCLYTIARNLCVDVYRRPQMEPLEAAAREEAMEERWITGLTVQLALAKLTAEERELLLLRYVNEAPVGTIGKLLGVSRFAVYRRLASASQKFQEELREEEFHESLEKGITKGV